MKSLQTKASVGLVKRRMEFFFDPKEIDTRMGDRQALKMIATELDAAEFRDGPGR